MPLVHIKLLLLERAKDAMEDDATAAGFRLARMRWDADRKAALEASTAMLKQLLPRKSPSPWERC